MSKSGSIALKLRPAAEGDVEQIWEILAKYSRLRLLLPRSRDDIRAVLSSFHVAEVDGRFAGCVALRDFGGGLYEVRSLAVPEELGGMGVGTALVKELLEHVATLKPCRLFALTYRSAFFKHLGFRVVDKSLFPEKIWSDCSICPKKESCDETAVLMEFN